MSLTANELMHFVQGSDITGASTYDIWKSINPRGTVEEFIAYFKGDSTYEVWVKKPENVGKSKEDFLNEIFDRVDWQSFTNHNVSTTSHSDIRELITDLTNRLNTLANSDDVTLDQMSELVAYIKNNRGLIDGITTSKINVADIVDNLTTASSNKVLSANQGVVLKSLIGTEVKKVQDTIGAIESGKTVVGMLAEMRQAYENGESQALSKAKDYTDAEINKVKSTIGTVTEGKTVMELLAESRTTAESNAKKYTDAEIVKVNTSITNLSNTHSADKTTLESVDTELKNRTTALENKVASLESVEHVEITNSQIDGLFSK